MTLAEAAHALRSRRLSPVELTDDCLARIERYDPVVNAFAIVDTEGARAAARAAERSSRLGPLHGIPVGVKDVIDVAGLPTRAHSLQLSGRAPATRDAASVARLRAAGTIVLGKLTTHEFSFGIPEWGPPGPPARNPWSPSRFAGGSSSGPAVATACSLTLGALGTDTAGSIRSPAALCGLTGFKPGASRIDRRGTIPLAQSLDTIGVVARTAEDCAILYHAVSWPPDANIEALHDDEGLPRFATTLAGLRVGVLRAFYATGAAVSDACAEAIDEALVVLAQLGCRVSDVTLPPLAQWHATGIVILLAEAFAYHKRWLETRGERYGSSFREALSLGAAVTAEDYINAMRQRAALTAAFDAVMNECDVLVCPIQRGEAPEFERLSLWDFLEQPSFGLPFNLADCPALSVCSGFGPTGLPLALQLIGRRGEESTLLQTGHAYQTVTGWQKCAPPLVAALQNR